MPSPAEANDIADIDRRHLAQAGIGMASLCCVTMAYNESFFLPIWVGYYSQIVGEECCYVIDHGSNDESTASLSGVNRVRIPRSAHDDHQRARFVEDFCSALLKYYDYVLFVDADEIVVADPERHATLLSFLDTAGDVSTCVGFELRHWVHHEPAIDLQRPILNQRAYAAPARAMCKPSLIRRRVSWTPGFHSYDGPPNFGGLFLFHLAYMDLQTALVRQRKRHTQFYPSKERDVPHHRAGADMVQAWIEGWAQHAAVDDATLRPDCPRLSRFLSDLRGSYIRREGGPYGFDISESPQEKWRIPGRFRDLF